MNKLSISLAFAAIAVLVLACSEDNKDPTHKELCSETPLKKECLVGSWNFEGVYRTESEQSPDCPEPGYLEFKADGGFTFRGGVNNIDNLAGTWSLNGNNITATYLEYVPITGTVRISSSGSEMVITASGNEAIFSLCNTDKIEKFRWAGK